MELGMELGMEFGMEFGTDVGMRAEADPGIAFRFDSRRQRDPGRHAIQSPVGPGGCGRSP
jgi:hypothetical protein